MHVIYHIENLELGHCGAWFTVQRDAEPALPSAPIQLEQAFTDRKTAVFTVLAAVETYVARRYNLEVQEITVEEVY